MKTYSELIQYPTFEERFRYLELDGRVGVETFGFDRYLNQKFYRSYEWKKVRNYVITRDKGCDLGIEEREIPNGVAILIHHINPITVKDIADKEDWIFDPEFLICTTKRTHDAIHYSDESILYSEPIERQPNDTTLWQKDKTMNESILTSIKKLLGLEEADTSFDPDLILHINTIFFTLNQLGVGPDEPFRITSKDETWDDFSDRKDIEAIKSYIYLKVRLLFDPPTNSAVLNAMTESAKEYEWRLNVAVDTNNINY